MVGLKSLYYHGPLDGSPPGQSWCPKAPLSSSLLIRKQLRKRVIAPGSLTAVRVASEGVCVWDTWRGDGPQHSAPGSSWITGSWRRDSCGTLSWPGRGGGEPRWKLSWQAASTNLHASGTGHRCNFLQTSSVLVVNTWNQATADHPLYP
jgi:hypothetical protein